MFSFGVMLCIIVKMDCIIEFFFGQVDMVVVGEQVQVDEGMLLLEFVQVWYELIYGEGFDYFDGEYFVVLVIFELGQYIGDVFEGLCYYWQQCQFFVGEGQVVWQVMEQGYVQLLFQIFDLYVYGGLGYV